MISREITLGAGGELSLLPDIYQTTDLVERIFVDSAKGQMSAMIRTIAGLPRAFNVRVLDDSSLFGDKVMTSSAEFMISQRVSDLLIQMDQIIDMRDRNMALAVCECEKLSDLVAFTDASVFSAMMVDSKKSLQRYNAICAQSFDTDKLVAGKCNIIVRDGNVTIEELGVRLSAAEEALKSLKWDSIANDSFNGHAFAELQEYRALKRRSRFSAKNVFVDKFVESDIARFKMAVDAFGEAIMQNVPVVLQNYHKVADARVRDLRKNDCSKEEADAHGNRISAEYLLFKRFHDTVDEWLTSAENVAQVFNSDPETDEAEPMAVIPQNSTIIEMENAGYL